MNDLYIWFILLHTYIYIYIIEEVSVSNILTQVTGANHFLIFITNIDKLSIHYIDKYNNHVVIKIQPNLLKSEYNQTKIESQIFSKADCLHYFIPNKLATI